MGRTAYPPLEYSTTRSFTCRSDISRSPERQRRIDRHRAVQTGHWHHWDPPARGEPKYRPEIVDGLLAEIAQLDDGWGRWFAEQGVEPLVVEYEALAVDPAGETKRVLTFLGLPTDVEPRPLTVKSRQA